MFKYCYCHLQIRQNARKYIWKKLEYKLFQSFSTKLHFSTYRWRVFKMCFFLHKKANGNCADNCLFKRCHHSPLAKGMFPVMRPNLLYDKWKMHSKDNWSKISLFISIELFCILTLYSKAFIQIHPSYIKHKIYFPACFQRNKSDAVNYCSHSNEFWIKMRWSMVG